MVLRKRCLSHTIKYDSEWAVRWPLEARDRKVDLLYEVNRAKVGPCPQPRQTYINCSFPSSTWECASTWTFLYCSDQLTHFGIISWQPSQFSTLHTHNGADSESGRPAGTRQRIKLDSNLDAKPHVQTGQGLV